MSRADPARLVAYQTLHAVRARGAYANLLLPRLLAEHRLSGRDAAFATELAYGTLRWQGSLDAVLDACLTRPRLDPRVRDVLRLGAYQLLRTRVPAHAAVDRSVTLAGQVVGPGAAGLVNAVLRRVNEHGFPDWVDRLAAGRDPVDVLALTHGHPRWVVAGYAAALHGDLAETGRALAVDRPEVHLVARPGRISRDRLLAEVGPPGRPAPWSPLGVRLAGGDPARWPAVRSGRAGVMDEGSQLAALALARAPVTGPDRRWLDACAGPGGKAAVLAGCAAARAAALVAVDRAAGRVRLTAAALAGRGPVLTADATRPAWPAGYFDRVLVDAPCSGLGALRRRPDARWRRGPDSLAGLVDLQRRLLTAAVRSVRVGGVVGYVTCSPHPAETVEVTQWALGTEAVEPVDARPLLAPLPDTGDGPAVQLWPHRHGTDAMFVALLRRVR